MAGFRRRLRRTLTAAASAPDFHRFPFSSRPVHAASSGRTPDGPLGIIQLVSVSLYLELHLHLLAYPLHAGLSRKIIRAIRTRLSNKDSRRERGKKAPGFPGGRPGAKKGGLSLKYAAPEGRRRLTRGSHSCSRFRPPSCSRGTWGWRHKRDRKCRPRRAAS